MPRKKSPVQQELKQNVRKNSEVEWKGYANIPLPENFEELLDKATDIDIFNLMCVTADFGFKISVEPVDDGYKCTVYGVRTDGGFADGVAVTGGGRDCPTALFVALTRMRVCEMSPENFLRQTNDNQRKFW